MCLAVYLATESTVPPIEWNKESPAFYLEAVEEGQPVCKQFSLPYVYYAGSHEGCGCGFSKDGEVGPELEHYQANYRSLGHTIRAALAQGSKVEVFTCWEGDQGDMPEFIESITPTELEAPNFELKELQFLHVTHDA